MIVDAVPHSTVSPINWNNNVAQLPGAHILQTWEWGQVKSRYGWQMHPRTWLADDKRLIATAMVLQRTIMLGGFATPLRMFYVPKGPLLDWGNSDLRQRVLDDLQTWVKQQGGLLIKIDPDVVIGRGVPGQPEAVDYVDGQSLITELRSRGWLFSGEQVQFRNTVLVDLRQPEEELLARMKQKTRYNIHLAQRKGVQVRVGSGADIPLLFHMYAETSVRDGFVIRDESYYHTVWSNFIHSGMAEPLIAEVGGLPVAAVIVFRFAGRAWYLFGMSRELHREKMPNYLLQWEAIRRSKAYGCHTYDLWGAPDQFEASDPLWGVYRFKEGLGGEVYRHLGAWDFPVHHSIYRIYTQILPRWLNWMRGRGKSRTRQHVAGSL